MEASRGKGDEASGDIGEEVVEDGGGDAVVVVEAVAGVGREQVEQPGEDEGVVRLRVEGVDEGFSGPSTERATRGLGSLIGEGGALNTLPWG